MLNNPRFCDENSLTTCYRKNIVIMNIKADIFINIQLNKKEACEIERLLQSMIFLIFKGI